jgi:DNA gyrase subunit A
LQLGQLAALERDEIFKEYGGLRNEIVAHELLLSSEKNILALIRKDMETLRDKYGDDRRTQIMEAAVGEVRFEDLIAEEVNAVTISHNGYIKRLPLSTYRAQHRGGRGVTGAQTHEDDFIEHFFVASTHAYLLFFTTRGQVYWVKVYDLPQMSRQAAGRAIANVLSLRPDEKITSVIPVRRFDTTRCLLMATKRGLVKKTLLEAYSRPRSGGLIGISIEEGDTLISVVMTQPGDEVVLSTRNGIAIRFEEADARAMGRDTRGVKGIDLREGDEVVGMVVTDPQGYLLTVCEKGYGKRTPFGANIAIEAEEAGEEPEEPTAPEAEATGDDTSGTQPTPEQRSSMRYRKQRRGGKGLRDIRTSERNGPVVAVASVRDGDELMLITQQGMVTRMRVDEIRVVGRNTQGVKLINLQEGDKVVTAAKIAREDVSDQPPEEPTVGSESPPSETPSPPTGLPQAEADETPGTGTNSE